MEDGAISIGEKKGDFTPMTIKGKDKRGVLAPLSGITGRVLFISLSILLAILLFLGGSYYLGEKKVITRFIFSQLNLVAEQDKKIILGWIESTVAKTERIGAILGGKYIENIKQENLNLKDLEKHCYLFIQGKDGELSPLIPSPASFRLLQRYGKQLKRVGESRKPLILSQGKSPKNKPILIIAVPFILKRAIYGVMVNPVDVEKELLPLLRRYLEGEELRIILVDRRGGLLIKIGNEGWVPPLSLALAAAKGEEGITETESKEGKSLASYRHIPSASLGLVVMEDEKRALLPLFALRRRTITFGIVGFAIFATIIWITARRLTKPIIKLTAGAKKIAEGNLDARIEIERDDELGELARAFNLMVSQLNLSLSALKAKSEALEKTVTELEKVNKSLKDKTKELEKTQEKLVKQERLAVLGQLASVISHELRNPLAVINNACYYLREKIEDEELKKFIDMISRETKIADGIIAHVLSFAKPRPPVFLPVNLGEVVSDALSVVKERGECKRAEIKMELPSSLPKLKGDPEKLRIVLVNLILNSCQAMPKGGKVTISAESKGEELILTVSDEGEGISKAKISSIFEPFYTTKKRGVGLGLSICKRIIEEHKGRIRVESRPGKGTTFFISLPLGRNDDRRKKT